MAMPATPGNLKVFEQERKKLQARMDDLRAQATAAAGDIESLVLVIPMRVGDNDKLYGSVTSHIIGDALALRGVDVDRRRILMDQPIRTIGDHHVRARLHADVVAGFTVRVVSEDKAHGDPESSASAPAEPGGAPDVQPEAAENAVA
jgi:large subunit ribosomal protein L9